MNESRILKKERLGLLHISYGSNIPHQGLQFLNESETALQKI